MAFPLTEEYLPKIVGEGKLEDCTDLTFKRFWDEYDYKEDRKQAEDYWKKMPDNEKSKAIGAIKRYKFACKAKSREMIYAIRYLRNKRYMDE
jgi:predicted transcriptional regulator